MKAIYSVQEIGSIPDTSFIEFVNRSNESTSYYIQSLKDEIYISYKAFSGSRVYIKSSPVEFIIATDDGEAIEATGKISSTTNYLYEFFVELPKNDIDVLEAMEEKIANIEDRLLTESLQSDILLKEIVPLKGEILKAKRYYTQMEFLTDDLAELNSKFTSIDKRFDKLLNYVLNLQESVEQVREAFQSQIDIQQNNLMKIFTVVTSIFMPLTLITGWYGMNIKMPEFKLNYMYPIVIALSLAIIIGLIFFFKKKKWF